MRSLLIFALLGLCPGPTFAQAGASVAHGVTAELTATPLEAEIGQPLEWRLVVRHPRGVSIIVPTENPVPDDSWVLVEGARRSSRADGDGRRETVVRWGVISLDPGERALPSIAVEFDAGGIPQHIASTAGTVTVQPALAEGEDVPRPPVGFRPPPPEHGRLSLWPLWVALGVLFTGVAALIFLRLRRRSGQGRAPLAPAARLSALEARRGSVGEEPHEVRGLYYELSALVREAVDRRAAPAGDADARPPALTDEEWLARLRATKTALPPEIPATVEELLRKAETVKYGQGAPTRFAVDEAFADARRVVETLERVPEPTAGEAS